MTNALLSDGTHAMMVPSTADPRRSARRSARATGPCPGHLLG